MRRRVICLLLAIFGVLAAAAVPARAATPNVVPAPQSSVSPPGDPFALAAGSAIVLAPSAAGAAPLAETLAGGLRRSTGLALPVATSSPDAPSIVLRISKSVRGGFEGYTLVADAKRLTIRGRSVRGLYRGIQTLRQLLPAAADSTAAQPGPWTVAPVAIADWPRFGYRGVTLDVARHFFTVAEVQRLIDEMALHKLNVLKLRLADDQGWRIAIDGWPKLTTTGGSLEVGGTPGGSYAKADYEAIVAYAAARYITVVPEVGMPAHVTAALASYAELTCDLDAPDAYTGTGTRRDSLCLTRQRAFTFVDDVVSQLAAITPGPWIGIGGDDPRGAKAADYRRWVGRTLASVRRHGKKAIGWEEITAGRLDKTVTVEAGRSDDAADLARAAVDAGAKVVLSPSTRVSLDARYTTATPFGQPALDPVEVRASYDWEPAALYRGVTEKDIRGVDATIWTQYIADTPSLEYLAFPRLAGLAERGWSPARGRDWSEYRTRLAAQGARWSILGLNFYRSPQVAWTG